VAWLMSRVYDRFQEAAERAGLREWRRALLEAAAFELAPCTEELLPGSSPVVGRSIRGVAHPPLAWGRRIRPGNP
jgi:hypothetical protein